MAAKAAGSPRPAQRGEADARSAAGEGAAPVPPPYSTSWMPSSCAGPLPEPTRESPTCTATAAARTKNTTITATLRRDLRWRKRLFEKRKPRQPHSGLQRKPRRKSKLTRAPSSPRRSSRARCEPQRGHRWCRLRAESWSTWMHAIISICPGEVRPASLRGAHFGASVRRSWKA